MLMIRLARVGARKQPYYRVVVIEKERARNGRSVEVVGTYNPRTNPATIDLKRDRIEHWRSKGARLSDRLAKLLAKAAPSSSESAAYYARRKVPHAGREPDMASEQGGDVRLLVEQIAKALVDEPEQVSVQAVDGEQVTVLELRVSPADLGKVIGKQGRTARSIRTILGAAGMKLHKRFTLEILE